MISTFCLEIGINKLVGKWKPRYGPIWECVEVEDIEFSCGGHQVTWDGENVTWVNTGETGTFDGDEIINWTRDGKNSSQWVKIGKYPNIYHK